MSVPLDRLYHYIQEIAEQVHGDNVLIYRFTPHGSKNIKDLLSLNEYSGKYSEPGAYKYPEIYCYDQEPTDYDFYQSCNYNIIEDLYKECYDINLTLFSQPSNLRVVFSIYDKCLLLHSEKRSLNISKYKNSHFIPVYYWAHGIIAQDWFRYAKHINIKPGDAQKQFLIYNRAWAGTREYRIKFVELLQKNNLINDCQTSFNQVDPEHNVHYTNYVFNNLAFKSTIINDMLPMTIANSNSSADFTIDDYANTKFEVVLETLFDDDRIQLTEKILRPIACGHPFILASTPGSLEYLRSYGFKTFDGIINETYDTEQDPVKRLQLIVNEMKTITEWSDETQLHNWNQINEITKYNKKHFFSKDFFELIVNELRHNLKTAFVELEETNTSRHYFDFRKSAILQDTNGKLKLYRKNEASQLIPVILKARSYYKRYLKSLE